MYLNNTQTTDFLIKQYRKQLLSSCPNHIVIDGLFDETRLDKVMAILQQPHHWQTQQHTYSALYVDSAHWKSTDKSQRFVQRDVWQRTVVNANIAEAFLSYLRGNEFMSLLSRIFNVQLTDINVAAPDVNTNYFRLAPTDFVRQHADDSPGRKVCMLLYLNKNWYKKSGGELTFSGKTTSQKNSTPITISPLYNRCVLFDPSSQGSEHWVEKVRAEYANQYRYNVTSWYWAK